MTRYIIKGEFEYEVDAYNKQEAIEQVQDNLADLNNLCYEIEKVPNEDREI